jgi:hypothetical protein
MKKPFFIVIGVFLALLSSCKKDPVTPVQLLINTDLEAGNSKPNAWVAGVNSVGSLEWTLEEAVSAKHSLKISQAVATGTNNSYWFQQYQGAMPIGKDLILSAKIKGKNITGLGATIDIRVDNSIPPKGLGSQYANSSATMTIQGDFDWTTYNVKLVNLNRDAKTITVFLSTLPNTSGTVYFDDIMLVHN